MSIPTARGKRQRGDLFGQGDLLYQGLMRIGAQVRSQIFQYFDIEYIFEDIRMVNHGLKKAVDLHIAHLDHLVLSHDFGLKGKGVGILSRVSPLLRHFTFHSCWEPNVAPQNNMTKIRTKIRELISRCSGSLTSIKNMAIVDQEDIEVLLECKRLTHLVPSKTRTWEDLPMPWLSKLWCGLELKQCLFPYGDKFCRLINEHPHLMKRPITRLYLGQYMDNVDAKLFDPGNWPGLQECSLCFLDDLAGLEYTIQRLSSEYSATLTSLSLTISNHSTDEPQVPFILDLPSLEYLSFKDNYGNGLPNMVGCWKLPKLKSLKITGFSANQLWSLMKETLNVHTLELEWTRAFRLPSFEIFELVAPSLRTLILSNLGWDQRALLSWFPSTLTSLDVSLTYPHLYLDEDAKNLVNLIGKFTSLKHLFVRNRPCGTLSTLRFDVPVIHYQQLQTLSISNCPFLSPLLSSIHAPRLMDCTLFFDTFTFLIDGLLDFIHRSPHLSMIHLHHVSDRKTEGSYPPLLNLRRLYCSNVHPFTWSVLQRNSILKTV